MKNSPYVLLISSLLFAVSCNSNGDEPVFEFDRSELLVNISENLIIPAYTNFDREVEELESLTEAFLSNKELSHLEVLQSKWVEVKQSWKLAEAFNFGPADDFFLATSVDSWPLNEAGLVAAIGDYNGSDSYLTSVGSDKKGLVAIEYLLFNCDTASILAAFEDDNRQSYLQLLVNELSKNSSRILVEGWNETFLASFQSDLSSGSSSSLNRLANSLICLQENVKNFKVATPAGIRTSSSPLPDLVESPYANASVLFIRENMAMIQAVYSGQDGVGFDDYLSGMSDAGIVEGNLNNEILSQFSVINEALNKVEIPLSTAVETDADNVLQLFIALQELTVLMKTEMMSQLGLTVTFSDNDGD